MQKEIQLTDKTLLVVSVPKEASDLTLPKVGIADLYFRTDDKEYEDGYISIGIPQGYEFLGKSKEMTEEKARMIFKRQATFGEDYYYYNSISFMSALKVFEVFMKANNIDYSSLILYKEK